MANENSLSLTSYFIFIMANENTLSLISFSRYCKDFANLLFQVLWVRLAILTNIDNINLQKGLYICMQKINFMCPLFLILIGIHSMQV